jgi:SAM-dependent methyltransferase
MALDHGRHPAGVTMIVVETIGGGDRFARQSNKYARYRPRYPAELFEHLAGLCQRRELAWDCATGSGQAAVALARHFTRVVATDASARQLAHAEPHARVEYRLARADYSALDAGAVDLITVATALHWLELDSFYAEARRVLRIGGVIAAWSYRDTRVSPAVDRVLRRYRQEIVGAHWAFPMELLTERYQTVPFPFRDLPVPQNLVARRELDLDGVFGYLESWSATQLCIERTGSDPRDAIRAELAHAWGDPSSVRTVEWPLFFRIGIHEELHQ